MGNFSKETEEKAKELRIIDDVLFRLVAARKEVCQEILQTLLDDKELIVLQAIPQEKSVSLHREVTLDVLCRLGDGRIVNVEMQKGNSNDDIRRCRFHLSSITAKETPKGTEFKDVPDVIVIYITEYDALKNGQVITCCEMCQKVDGVYYPLSDGAKVYYANTVVKDNSDKSELLELFLRKDSFENKKFPNISNAMKYFKNDTKGVSEVCTIVEEYAKEYAKEYGQNLLKKASIDLAIQMIKDNSPIDKIVQYSKLSAEEILALKEEIED